MNIRFCVALAASVLGTLPAFGQDWRGVAFSSPEGPRRGIQTLTTDPVFVAEAALAREIVVDAFPLADGNLVTLTLNRFEPMTADAQIVVMTPTGPENLGPLETTFWTGGVDSDPSARVYLAVSALRVDGFILSDTQTWVISSGPAGEVLPTVVYDMRTVPADLVRVSGGGCNALIPPGGLPQIAQAAPGGFGDRGAPCRIVTVAIETDHETTIGVSGNPAMAADYLTRLMGAVSVIYQRDLNVSLQIPYMRLWTTPEDPWDQSEMGAQLGQFRDHWAAGMRGIRRSLSHFLTFRGLGGGVAWVGTICNYDYGFGLSSGVGGGFPYPLRDRDNRNWPLFVTAHELGHNFGTGHTHDSYNPVIDGCGNGDCSDAANGTIMSYCHGCAGGMTNISLRFGPRVVDQIQSYLDTIPPACGMTGSLLIRAHPVDVRVRRGRSFTLSAAATGPGVPAFAWERDGVAVTGGSTGQFTIAQATPNHAGSYRAEAFTPCASRWTYPAQVTVLCRADFNHDGFVDFFDYDAYIACFEGFACDDGETADSNGDGFVDFFDYDAFVATFLGPC